MFHWAVWHDYVIKPVWKLEMRNHQALDPACSEHNIRKRLEIWTLCQDTSEASPSGVSSLAGLLGRFWRSLMSAFWVVKGSLQSHICVLLISIHPSIYLSIYLSDYLYIYLSIYLSVYISIYLSAASAAGRGQDNTGTVTLKECARSPRGGRLLILCYIALCHTILYHYIIIWHRIL